MRDVSKDIFLNSIICPSFGWLIRNDKVKKTTNIGDKFRMEQGLEIGKRSRMIYPDGILIDDKDIITASEKTKTLMSNPKNNILFEATFSIDEYVCKADVLIREKGGWHLVEVKSSVNDKSDFIDDMAYTAMVIQKCGYSLSKISLMLISRDFRLGMKNKDLFTYYEHTDEVLERVEQFKQYWESVEESTKTADKPETSLRFECKKCSLFADCEKKNFENHIFDLPRLSKTKFELLTDLGIFCIEDIPEKFKLTANQERVRQCVISKKISISDELASSLNSLIWPVFYLDFESMSTAIPPYPDIAPYEKIPTQYSVHKYHEFGGKLDHFEYISDPSKDCRRMLAEKLIEDMKGEGSILVYSNFEKTILNILSDLFPDLKEKLESITQRFVDLESIIRNNFYHPDFHGSTSIKVTLPVLVPSMTYDGLDVADGDTAMAEFAFMAQGKYNQSQIEKIRKDLLEYCKQDTLAMVKLHEKLFEYVNTR